MTEQPGRDDLARWMESRPTNYYEATPNLRSVLDIRAGATRTAAMEPGLKDFGRRVAEVIDPAVETLDVTANCPPTSPTTASVGGSIRSSSTLTTGAPARRCGRRGSWR